MCGLNGAFCPSRIGSCVCVWLFCCVAQAPLDHTAVAVFTSSRGRLCESSCAHLRVDNLHGLLRSLCPATRLCYTRVGFRVLFLGLNARPRFGRRVRAVCGVTDSSRHALRCANLPVACVGHACSCSIAIELPFVALKQLASVHPLCSLLIVLGVNG